MSKNVLILDNDETTGYYSDLAMYMYHVMRFIAVTKEAEIVLLNKCIMIMEEYCVFRPGLRQFMQTIAARKREGIIYKVVMYTNAFMTPGTGWISVNWGPITWAQTLSKMFDRMAGYDDLFDLILTRLPEDRAKQYPLKDFNRVVAGLGNPTDLRMHFLDDRSGEILNSNENWIAHSVLPYKYIMHTTDVISALTKFMNNEVIVNFTQLGYTDYIIRIHVPVGDSIGVVPPLCIDEILPMKIRHYRPSFIIRMKIRYRHMYESPLSKRRCCRIYRKKYRINTQ